MQLEVKHAINTVITIDILERSKLLKLFLNLSLYVKACSPFDPDPYF
jgi:hypothetical protein